MPTMIDIVQATSGIGLPACGLVAWAPDQAVLQHFISKLHSHLPLTFLGLRLTPGWFANPHSASRVLL